MKMVHGCLCSRNVFGVRAPPGLPASVTGDLGPPAREVTSEELLAPAGDASGNVGVDTLLGVAVSLSAFSRSLRSFLSFFFAFSRSALSPGVPFVALETGLSWAAGAVGGVSAPIVVLPSVAT